MRFEVPQFIEIEDKIIGPLTWKQFVYLAGGAGILVILFLSTSSFLLFLIIGLPIGALSAALAFHQVNNRPFSFFLEAVITYFSKGKLYLWRRDTMQSIIERSTLNISSDTKGDQSGIASLSHKLEHHLPE